MGELDGVIIALRAKEDVVRKVLECNFPFELVDMSGLSETIVTHLLAHKDVEEWCDDIVDLEEACNCMDTYYDPTEVRGAMASTSGEVPSSSNVSYGGHMGQQSGEYATALESEIEASKVHWSELSSDMGEQDDRRKKIAESNSKVFRKLQQKFRTFFWYWKGSQLVLGEKIAEGGQAEIYTGTITQFNVCRSAVINVFKLEGAFLHDIQHQLSLGLMQGDPYDIGKHVCVIHGAGLLDDGRFAFHMKRYWGDLRNFDFKIKDNRNEDPLFPDWVSYRIMREIAIGMEGLQSISIHHKDLKASNILIESYIPHNEQTLDSRPPSEFFRENEVCCPRHTVYFKCLVADFECTGGVVGTGFWRAPEILHALKDKDIHNKSHLFSESADVYSYAMTCYEVLTGKYPFEDVPKNDYEVVYSGRVRLEWPKNINPQVKKMLERCSQLEPAWRPRFSEISRILQAREPQ